VRRLLLAIVLTSALSAQPDALAARSREAKQLMAAGRFAEAAALYEELVRAVPSNPGLLLNLGMAQHMGGRDREALAQFEKVLKMQPNALPALMLGAASWMRLGEPAKALPLLRKGLAISPGDKQGRQMLVDALLMLGRLEEAAAELEKAVAADKTDARLWYGLGRTYEGLAQRGFEQLQKLAPESEYTMVLVAESQASRGRNGSAFQLFREALKKSATAPGAHAGLAQVYRSTGHADWAATAEERERSLPVPNCAAKPWQCQFAAGRVRAAAAAARAAKTPEALFWLTRSYNKLAAQAFARLEELPPSPELHEIRAEVFRNQGRHADSVREWEAALKLDPASAQAQRELATSIFLSRDYVRAEPLIREQLRRDPNTADLHFYLGDILLNQQKQDEAMAEFRRAIDLDSKLFGAHAALGRALMQAGRAAEAVPHLEAAREIDIDGSIHYQLARAYQTAGRAEPARAALARYQELSKAAAAGTEGVDAEITAP
jgi:tetratricopeptide (TPR) repeat protein